MTSQTPTYVAIDIAKAGLQTQIGPHSYHFENTPEGFAKLDKVLSKVDQPHVVFEATGGYERALMTHLFARGITLSRVNPCRIHSFIRSLGVKAKSDPIDTRMILKYAETMRPRPDHGPDQSRVELGLLLDRHHQLSGMLAQEKNRLQMAGPVTRPSIQGMIERIEDELSRIDARMRTLVSENATMNAQDKVMRSVKGVGYVTSWSILAYLGEMTHLTRNEVVALAGLAPYIKESSTIKKKRKIEAGRAKVRKCLYMAAQSAANCNPVIREYVERHKAREKAHKWVMVAAMRKLLIHLHSLLKNHKLPLAA
jgi:transposase